jgi:hypothetical protein
MSCLQGYVVATYDELANLFGAPTYDEPSGDGKVNTEWEFYRGNYGEIRIYDWKDYDGGERSRNGQPYKWHIGGKNQRAVEYFTDLNMKARSVYY